MRILPAAILLSATTACASWHSFHSETTIGAGQSFLLGGQQERRFAATVRNTGRVPVAVLVESDGSRRPVTVLQPAINNQANLPGSGVSCCSARRWRQISHNEISGTTKPWV